MYVAQKEGLFEKHKLKVELIPVASAPERDQVFAAAQVDGMINEALVTALINKDQVHAQVVRYARTATQAGRLVQHPGLRQERHHQRGRLERRRDRRFAGDGHRIPDRAPAAGAGLQAQRRSRPSPSPRSPTG